MSKKSLTTKKPLYIFFHTQKCAGSTLRYHLERNFQEDEVIFLYLHGHFDVRNKIHEPFRTKKFREAVDTYLSRLTGEQKDRVRVLCGHEIYYGIHQFFPNKEPKYVTFVRHHVVREVSMYNFHRDHVENPSFYPPEDQKEAYGSITLNERKLSFEGWLNAKKWHSNFMFKVLKQHGFGKTIEDILKKFYFIGSAENYNTDALFLYHLLGIKKFYSDQNISKKYVDAKNLSKELRDVLDERNKKDMRLYEHALFLNKNFKKKSLYFWYAVFCVKMIRMPLAKFKVFRSRHKTPLRIAYDASFILRHRIPFYARLLDALKQRVKTPISLQ